MNAQIAKTKIEHISSDTTSVAKSSTSKKKLKSQLEELFGKGRRLPIFSEITTTEGGGDSHKKGGHQKKPSNAAKNTAAGVAGGGGKKGQHRFAK